MSAVKPLDGVRVIDLTVVWAGTFAATLLADLGAEVIKVENIHVWQPMTRGGVARPPAAALTAGAGWAMGYPYGVPGERPWNYPPTFVQMFRNKYSVTIDLLSDAGREAFGRLVERSDALVENNAAGTLEKLGIGPDFLRAHRPDLIALRMPAYGQSGPYREARALGVHLESVMGHTMLRGYPDLDPSYITAIFSGDYVAGAHGAFAIMAALRHRRRTGEGQFIELAQAECAGGMLAQAFMDYALNGVVQERIGNASLDGDAPHGVYPARSQGDMGDVGDASDGGDRWISITVLNDAQWRGLRAAMGDPDWAQAAELETAEGRRAAQDQIDRELSAWTAQRDDYELFHLLQSHGVPAAPVLAAPRVLDDPHVQARGLNHVRTLADGVGPFRFNGPFYRFEETPVDLFKPPAALGEDNEYVYGEILGYSAEQIAAMEAAGQIGRDYDPDIP